MKEFYDSSPALLNPIDLVRAFTKKTTGELALPARAIIVFLPGDLKNILARKNHRPIKSWARLRQMYHVENTGTIILKSFFSGPNIAALVEELSSFGVKEFILWGYCGGINGEIRPGDVIAANGALREEGTSWHYIKSSGSKDREEFIYTNWFDEWEESIAEEGFRKGLIWTCDALYRETENKVIRYRKMGISAVEMEVASFYTVCRYRGVKGIAFLIVSDLLNESGWTPGFHTKEVEKGTQKLLNFIVEKTII